MGMTTRDIGLPKTTLKQILKVLALDLVGGAQVCVIY